LSDIEHVRFTGNVYAMPEGSLTFPNEPLMQVIALILEAQLMETFVLNQVHFQSLVVSKAARVVGAAKGRMVVDFGSRRAHGTDAALKVAWATYLAGGQGTSNVLAGKLYGFQSSERWHTAIFRRMTTSSHRSKLFQASTQAQRC
jgi:nicotinate phosphoribosyltransferase